MKLLTGAAIAPALLLLSACGDAASVAEGPADPSAMNRPDLMIVEPAEAKPGEVVQLTFPEGTDRGISFVLEQREGESWQLEYRMLSGANGGEPETVRASEPFDSEAVGILGQGPDLVKLPEDVSPGQYRICTANSQSNLCSPLEIVE